MEPWYVDIFNYLAAWEMPMQWTKDNKEHVLHGLGISYGTTLICLNIAKTKSLGGVCLLGVFKKIETANGIAFLVYRIGLKIRLTKPKNR